MTSFRTTSRFGDGPPMGPATKGLLIITLAASLVFTLTEKSFGFGVTDLIFTVGGVLSLELWRLVTYPFVEIEPFSLLLSLLFLYLMGRFFEMQWGSRAFLRFFVASSAGAAALAVPLSFVVNAVAPFSELGMAAGPDAAFDAMLVAMAVHSPDTNVLFGFVLPIRARRLVLVILGIQVIFGIMSGAAALSITLGGIAMGYVLSTGIWRPARLLHWLRGITLRNRRRGLHVVPPVDKTLH